MTTPRTYSALKSVGGFNQTLHESYPEVSYRHMHPLFRPLLRVSDENEVQSAFKLNSSVLCCSGVYSVEVAPANEISSKILLAGKFLVSNGTLYRTVLYAITGAKRSTHDTRDSPVLEGFSAS